MKKINERLEKQKMKYNCKHCSFNWDGNSDTFKQVLVHEKTHLKKMSKLIVGEK